MKQQVVITAAMMLLSAATICRAQSSSLYLEHFDEPVLERASNGVVSRITPAARAASYAAVRLPELRRFAVQDLVTIIISESTQSNSDAKLETKKDSSLDATISAFPEIKLFNGLLPVRGGTLADPPKVGVSAKNDFKSDGTYNRKDTFTSRVTARIIDIKPNGLLVLEARKYIKSDEEAINLLLTGTCRKEDVTIDNTVLSTQLYDLHLDKQGDGQVRKGSGKGVLTKLLDAIFNF